MKVQIEDSTPSIGSCLPPLAVLAFFRGCLIFLTVCAGASGCDSGECRSDSEQTVPNSEQPRPPSVERGPQDALLLAQRAHGLFLDVAGSDAFVWHLGTSNSGGGSGPILQTKAFWVWLADSMSGPESYVYLQLIPSWSGDEFHRGGEVGLNRSAPFRWRSHRIAVFGDPNDVFNNKIKEELRRVVGETHQRSSRKDEGRQAAREADTLLLAQRASHEFAEALGGFWNMNLTNHGFAQRRGSRRGLEAEDCYIPRIAPQGDKPVWLWRVWSDEKPDAFLLIEVLPDRHRVQHAGVMQTIKDYGPHTVQEHTWEGHGIRLYVRKGQKWGGEVMAAFTDHFSPVQAEEDEPHGG